MNQNFHLAVDGNETTVQVSVADMAVCRSGGHSKPAKSDCGDAKLCAPRLFKVKQTRSSFQFEWQHGCREAERYQVRRDGEHFIMGPLYVY